MVEARDMLRWGGGQHCFVFPETQFITVTAYQNNKVRLFFKIKLAIRVYYKAALHTSQIFYCKIFEILPLFSLLITVVVFSLQMHAKLCRYSANVERTQFRDFGVSNK